TKNQVLALRGVCRLLTSSTTVSADQRTTLGLQALDVARRPDEKKLVIAALGTLPTQAAADRLLALANESAYKNEAALAAVTLAGLMQETDRQAARDLAQSIVDLDVSPQVKDRANEILTGRGGRRR
ncbi:hypothetical protein ACFL6U_29765, partial [Planctomycetota bacterium]